MLRRRGRACAAIAILLCLVAGPSIAGSPVAQASTFADALPAIHLDAGIIGMAATPDGAGCWLIGADGGVFSLGDAHFYGSTGGLRLDAPVRAVAPTADGGGYWLAADDGGVFSFGDARFYGSEGGTRLAAPIVGMARGPGGAGYWLVGTDGGVFSFGSARFYGSTGAVHLVEPVVAMAATADGRGYWLVARDGGVFAFGDAAFHGSASDPAAPPVVGIAPTAGGGGYWILRAGGEVEAFGDARWLGDATGAVAGHGAATSIAAAPGGRYLVGMADGDMVDFGGATLHTAAPDPPGGPSTNSVAQVAADMTVPNTVFPQGMPSSWSWYAGAQIGAGDTPPRGYDSLTSWGTVYPASTGSTATNTSVELRDEETWVFSRSHARWEEIQFSAQPVGQWYREDLAGNISQPASQQHEPDGGTAVAMVPGMALQFWPTGSRPTIDPADIGGIYVTVQARLIVDDPSRPVDLADAHYIIDTGADYWLDPTAPYPDNANAVVSRFDTLGTSYASTSATTMTPAQLAADPPPFDAGP